MYFIYVFTTLMKHCLIKLRVLVRDNSPDTEKVWKKVKISVICTCLLNVYLLFQASVTIARYGWLNKNIPLEEK